MQIGDLVKYRRLAVVPGCAAHAGVGIVVKQAPEICLGPAWWSILWSTGEIESVRIGTLKVINANR